MSPFLQQLLESSRRGVVRVEGGVDNLQLLRPSGPDLETPGSAGAVLLLPSRGTTATASSSPTPQVPSEVLGTTEKARADSRLDRFCPVASPLNDI